MSRSFKHTTISGITTATSEKRDKQLANRRFRRISRHRVRIDEEPLINLNEISDPWDFQKDGKRYFFPDEAKLFPKLFRK
jgi:hypothetical protein